jgi:hypothetical protein
MIEESARKNLFRRHYRVATTAWRARETENRLMIQCGEGPPERFPARGSVSCGKPDFSRAEFESGENRFRHHAPAPIKGGRHLYRQYLGDILMRMFNASVARP